MSERKVPTIFSAKRRASRAARALSRAVQPDAASWLIDEMTDDIVERVGFMNLEPARSLVVGLGHEKITHMLDGEISAAHVLDEEQPLHGGQYDLVISVGRLDTVNDLPGALLHARMALSDGGIFLATFIGAGSLPQLRQIMLAGDGERAAARIHPQIDNRAATALMERAGFSRQVIDSSTLQASYRTLDRMVNDLRDQGLGNVLADVPPAMSKIGLKRAREAFDSLSDDTGRVIETFEILTLTGWR